MLANEFATTEPLSSDVYIARAHRLRAEAMRNGFSSLGRGLKRAMQAVSARFHRSAHA